MTSKLEWYGYKHVDGGFFVKRFLGDMGDIQEARQSNFVKRVTGPFNAKDKHEAMDILRARFGR